MSRAIAGAGVWEPDEIEWARNHVSIGMGAINVGANFGYFSRLLSNLVGPQGNVYAFEPNPRLFKLLERNMRSNESNNTLAYEYACGSSSGKANLYLNETNLGDNRLFDPRLTRGGGSWRKHGFAKRPRKAKVPVVSLDQFLGGKRIDVGIIDVQGWEVEVIRGMEKIISQWRPSLLVEFTPGWLSDLGKDPLEVLRYYESLGYSLTTPGAGKPGVKTPETILNQIGEADYWYLNLGLEPNPD